MDPTEEFLREVARLIPDADVVNVHHPPPPEDAPPPADVAEEDAELLSSRAIEELEHVWRRMLPTLPTPDVVHVRWIAEHYPEALRVEASARLAGVTSRAVEQLADPYDLGQDGWAVTRKVRAGGGVQIRAARGSGRIDVVAAPADDVVVARVVSDELVVGGLGKRLLAAGATAYPWPA